MSEYLMETLDDLCEMASDELRKYTEKLQRAGGDMSAGDLECLDKLTHMIKSIKGTMAMMDDGHSGADGGGSYANRYSRNSYGGGSYARGGSRRAMGGRYSRDAGGLAMQVRDLMDEAPNEVTRQEMQRLAKMIENA